MSEETENRLVEEQLEAESEPIAETTTEPTNNDTYWTRARARLERALDQFSLASTKNDETVLHDLDGQPFDPLITNFLTNLMQDEKQKIAFDQAYGYTKKEASARRMLKLDGIEKLPSHALKNELDHLTAQMQATALATAQKENRERHGRSTVAFDSKDYMEKLEKAGERFSQFLDGLENIGSAYKDDEHYVTLRRLRLRINEALQGADKEHFFDLPLEDDAAIVSETPTVAKTAEEPKVSKVGTVPKMGASTNRNASDDGETVHLTPREFKAFLEMVEQGTIVTAKEVIMNRLVVGD